MPLLFVHDHLTRMSSDVIINEICPAFEDGGTVNHAVHMAAGKKLLNASRKLERCKTGETVFTKGYDLPARHIIHIMTPLWNDSNLERESQLQNCYTRCLYLAAGKHCKTVAFPLLAGTQCGDAAGTILNIAVNTITSFLKDHELTVYLVLSDRSAFSKCLTLFREMQYFVDISDAKTSLEKPASAAPKHEQTVILSADSIESDDTAVVWYPDSTDERKTVEELFRKKQESAVHHASDTTSIPPAAPAPPAPSAVKRDEQSAQSFILPQYAPPHHPSPECGAKNQTSFLGSRRRADDLSRDTDFTRWVNDSDDGFSDSLLHLIDRKGMTDVQCYKKANISRKLFSKIRSDSGYRPSKTTVVAFALALELTLPETQELLGTAGYTLSRSFKFDRIIEYCIDHKVYNVFSVNEVLFAFDQSLLGG